MDLIDLIGSEDQKAASNDLHALRSKINNIAIMQTDKGVFDYEHEYASHKQYTDSCDEKRQDIGIAAAVKHPSHVEQPRKNHGIDQDRGQHQDIIKLHQGLNIHTTNFGENIFKSCGIRTEIWQLPGIWICESLFWKSFIFGQS